MNWEKLVSRKFMLAILALMTSILMAFGVNASTIERVSGIITAFFTVVAYIVVEGQIDVARTKNQPNERDNYEK